MRKGSSSTSRELRTYRWAAARRANRDVFGARIGHRSEVKARGRELRFIGHRRDLLLTSIFGEEMASPRRERGGAGPSGCGKHASKWWEVVPCVNKPVDNVTTFGQKFLISAFEATPARRVWHSITRSSRSTCRMKRRTERGFGSGGERGLARGTELLQRAAEFGPRSVTTNDVKCQPSSGGLSDTGQRVMCLREPRGAGELRLTGHSGFSAFYGRITGSSSDVSPTRRGGPTTHRYRRCAQSLGPSQRSSHRTSPTPG